MLTGQVDNKAVQGQGMSTAKVMWMPKGKVICSVPWKSTLHANYMLSDPRCLRSGPSRGIDDTIDH